MSTTSTPDPKTQDQAPAPAASGRVPPVNIGQPAPSDAAAKATSPTDAKANAYLATRVMTATPEQLRLMLLEGAVKFARQGRDGLAKKQYEQVFNGFSKCRAIIVELLTTMKPEPDRQLYDRLSSLYLFMITRLMEASHERDVSKADEVIKLLDYERETWVMLMAKLAENKRSATGPTIASQPSSSGSASGTERPTLSLSIDG